MLRSPVTRALALGLVAAMAGTGIAFATTGLNAVGTVLSRGPLEAGVKIHTDDLKFSTRNDIDVVTQTITIKPGGHTGRHSHEGPVFVTIQSIAAVATCISPETEGPSTWSCTPPTSCPSAPNFERMPRIR